MVTIDREVPPPDLHHNFCEKHKPLVGEFYSSYTSPTERLGALAYISQKPDKILEIFWYW